MKFVDEAVITVEAGKGGNGCLSFRREKFIPRGGPDGGNGGRGGSVYLHAVAALNTLADFRYTRNYRGPRGASGSGRDRSGRGGEDLIVDVPVGTVVTDDATGELIGDLVDDGHTMLVAAGGNGGLGNANFKSSINRAPRRITQGRDGEARRLRLELKILADIGLLGLPNAGKSTLLRAISEARPKVADYPFTTLYPHLGVVYVGQGQSFVVADIPGLIAGAAGGAGLGVQFLRHLSRTRLLLHVVDMAPFDSRPLAEDVRTIHAELQQFSAELATRERWLVLNKSDLLPAAEHQARRDDVARDLEWCGPVFVVSSATGDGCDALCLAVADHLQDPQAYEYRTSRKFRGPSGQPWGDDLG